jgi:pimeloyl-ACP methyl ester carboxylesterase
VKFETRRFAVPGGIHIVADMGGNPAHPLVILQHGGGQTRHSWGRAMRDLVAAGYYVANLDARGHGDSDWAPGGDYSLESLSSDLRAVIAELGSRPALVGASMGGACSLFTVGHSATPIASALILVDIVPNAGPEGVNKILDFMRTGADGFATLEEVADAVAAYNPHRARPKDPRGLMKNLRLKNGRLYWHWDPAFMLNPRARDRAAHEAVLLEATRHVTIPTLLVRGLKSDIVTDAGVAQFKQYLPSLEVFDVGGAGHMVAGDKNDAFDDGVISFLQRHVPITP